MQGGRRADAERTLAEEMRDAQISNAEVIGRVKLANLSAYACAGDTGVVTSSVPECCRDKTLADIHWLLRKGFTICCPISTWHVSSRPQLCQLHLVRHQSAVPGPRRNSQVVLGSVADVAM